MMVDQDHNLEKIGVQWPVFISMWSPIRTAQTTALIALLHIAPVDIGGKCMVAKAAIRLKESGYLDDYKHGLSGILAHFDFVPKYFG